MTDFKDEQRTEIEALEAIYSDEFCLLNSEPYHEFQIAVGSKSDHSDAKQVCLQIKFTYTERYPEEPLKYELIDEDESLEHYDDILMDFIKSQIEESLGMPMVFTIVSALQEKLTDLVDGKALEQLENRERKLKEEEEAEQKRFDGTRVTIESFLVWKEKFTAELNQKKLEAGLLGKKDPNKLTGRELFLTDQSMDDSDITFLESADQVEVDESLFEEIGDLELDEELSD